MKTPFEIYKEELKALEEGLATVQNSCLHPFLAVSKTYYEECHERDSTYDRKMMEYICNNCGSTWKEML